MDNDQDCPYSISPLAKAFPPLDKVEYARLLASIRDRGLRTPIVVWQGEIIDGVHRLRACIEADVEPRYQYLEDHEDPYRFLVDVSMPYRHMTQNEKALTAHLMSQYSMPGRPQSAGQNSANLRSITQGEAASLVGVSQRLVSDARRVLSPDSPAAPALQEAVLQWRVKCSDAAKVVELPPEVQSRAVELMDKGDTRTIKGAVERVEKEMGLAEQAAARAEIMTPPLDDAAAIHTATVADLHGLVPEGSVDAIITHPPHTEEALPLLADLAAFAAHALKANGVMAVVGNGVMLPRMLERLTHQALKWLAEFDLVFHGKPVRSVRPHYMHLHRRPILVYEKGQFRPSGIDDLVEVPPEEALPKGITEHERAMDLLVERFCRPGQTVCDPIMLDRAGTALAARRLGCAFVGASERQSSIDRIRVRLARAD